MRDPLAKDRRICAFHNSVLPTHGYAVLDRLKRERESLKNCSCLWQCHPLQALSISMLGIPFVAFMPRPNPMDLVKPSPYKIRFMGFPVSENDIMPNDQITFERDGVILADIFSLAVPVIPKFEDEFK